MVEMNTWQSRGCHLSFPSTFYVNQAVNLGANAFTITVLGQGGQVPTIAYASPDGGLTWVATFSGSSVIGNSIANGEYQIVFNAPAVSAVSGGGILAASDTKHHGRGRSARGPARSANQTQG